MVSPVVEEGATPDDEEVTSAVSNTSTTTGGAVTTAATATTLTTTSGTSSNPASSTASSGGGVGSSINGVPNSTASALETVLATAGYDHTIKLWHIHTALCVKTFQHPDSVCKKTITID